MKIYLDGMIIECSAEEFVKIKDDMPDIEEEKAFENNAPENNILLFDYFNNTIDKFYSSLYSSPNYD